MTVRDIRLRSSAIVVLAMLSSLLGGCGLSPYIALVKYGYVGRVVEADTGAAAPNADLIFKSDNYEVGRVRTNAEGRFGTNPEHRISWTWLGGPVEMAAPPTSVSIRSSGTEFGTFAIAEWWRSNSEKKDGLPCREIKDGCLDFGDILVRRAGTLEAPKRRGP